MFLDWRGPRPVPYCTVVYHMIAPMTAVLAGCCQCWLLGTYQFTAPFIPIPLSHMESVFHMPKYSPKLDMQTLNLSCANTISDVVMLCANNISVQLQEVELPIHLRLKHSRTSRQYSQLYTPSPRYIQEQFWIVCTYTPFQKFPQKSLCEVIYIFQYGSFAILFHAGYCIICF